MPHLIMLLRAEPLPHQVCYRRPGDSESQFGECDPDLRLHDKHARILAAVQAGDTDDAVALMKAHIDSATIRADDELSRDVEAEENALMTAWR